MEYNIRKYQFHQNGKDYVVSTGLVYDQIRITCQENLALDGPFYSNEFSLYDLQNIHQFFRLTKTPEEALKEINKGIERQKTGLKLDSNDVMHFLGYLVLGTDNDVFVLNLKRNYEPNKYGIFTPPSNYAADLILTTNYKVDGTRLNFAEINEGNLQREQTMIEEELNNIIPKINKLKRISMDIEEENALIKERIRILQKKLEEKKFKVSRLKEENTNLKRENQNLMNEINQNQNIIRNKQVIQTQVNIKPRPNINQQTSAVVSKFEQSALRTFFPRTGAKLNIEEYSQNNNYDYNFYNNYNNNYITTEISPTYTTYENDILNQYQYPTQVLPTVYEMPQPVQQPVVYYSQSTPKLRLSNRTNVSYKNTTYRVNLNSSAKEVVYKNKVYNPILNKNNIIQTYTKNDNKLESLTDKINYLGENKNINKDYVKPMGSRLPKVNLGNYSKSPSHKSNNKNKPVIGYSNYKPNEDNKN